MLFLVLGITSLILGILGVLLPVLPGTPFLLLAGYFFANSSNKIYQWMLKIPGVGNVILDWHRTKSIGLNAKIWSTIYLWMALFFSMHRLYPKWPLIAMLFMIGVSVTIFLWTRPTKK
ncbi:MAG: YbaN family protein [Bacteriovoracaceae bacterium]|nr:YbaN family protein [Bacteriovoracaceae bacterium]